MTNAGTTSGAARSTAQTRRPGSVVRSTSQAAPTPTTAQAGTARPSRATRVERAARGPAAGRSARRTSPDRSGSVMQRRCRRAGQRERGDRDRRDDESDRQTRSRLVLRGRRSGRGHLAWGRSALTGRSEDAGLRHQVGRPACCRASTDRWSARRARRAATSSGLAATSLAIAYSKDVPVCRIVWPSTPVMNSRNAWAAAAFLLDFRTPPPGHAHERTRILVLEVVELDVLAVLAGLGLVTEPVVVVDDAGRDLAGVDRLHDRRVALVGGRSSSSSRPARLRSRGLALEREQAR